MPDQRTDTEQGYIRAERARNLREESGARREDRLQLPRLHPIGEDEEPPVGDLEPDTGGHLHQPHHHPLVQERRREPSVLTEHPVLAIESLQLQVDLVGSGRLGRAP